MPEILELLARTQIKDAVFKLVKESGAAGFVEKMRVHPADKKKFPAVLIYQVDDVHDEDNDDDALAKVLSLSIEALVADGNAENADDRVDQVCLKVTQKLEADPTVGGLCSWSDLAGTEFDFSGKGDSPLLSAQMTWNFHYHVEKGNPQTIIKNI